MESGQNGRNWKQSVENLKGKWTDFANGIVFAAAEEEMRICREELNSHVAECSQPGASPEAKE